MRTCLVAMVLLGVASGALAQQSAPKPADLEPGVKPSAAPRPSELEPGVNTSAAPKPSDLEPGVNTSAPSPSNATPSSKAAAAAPEKPAPKAAAAGKPAAAVPSKTDTPATAKTDTARKGGSGKAEDHLQLDTTQITGNQELPKVLYIVPWKRSDLGDLLGKPANSLLDEVLEPVDRDVFKRQNRYYDALKPDTGGEKGAAASPTSGSRH
jgi:hypothetical protein